MVSKPCVDQAVECLSALQEESDFNKKCKAKAQVVITLLLSNEELAIDKALGEMEELTTIDLPIYHKTQVWDIISLLESAK